MRPASGRESVQPRSEAPYRRSGLKTAPPARSVRATNALRYRVNKPNVDVGPTSVRRTLTISKFFRGTQGHPSPGPVEQDERLTMTVGRSLRSKSTGRDARGCRRIGTRVRPGAAPRRAPDRGHRRRDVIVLCMPWKRAVGIQRARRLRGTEAQRARSGTSPRSRSLPAEVVIVRPSLPNQRSRRQLSRSPVRLRNRRSHSSAPAETLHSA